MLIGSANLDRRSFDTNFENNILLHDGHVTKEVLARQQSYVESSIPISDCMVAKWS